MLLLLVLGASNKVDVESGAIVVVGECSIIEPGIRVAMWTWQMTSPNPILPPGLCPDMGLSINRSFYIDNFISYYIIGFAAITFL